MRTLEERIRAVEDRDAIRELTARYCHAVVRGDGSAIVDLFTGDGVLEMGERTFRGRDQLRRVYGENIPEPTPKPFIQNHVIELAGDTARGICSVEIRLVQDGEAYTAAGHYEDEYRRVNERWKLARRKFVVYHWVPLRKGWA